MKIKTFCLLVLFLFTATVRSQDLPLIPWPASVEELEGVFEINDETVIVSSEPSWEEANYFTSWLEINTGHHLKLIDVGPEMPKTNYILFVSGETVGTFDQLIESYAANPLPNYSIDRIEDTSEDYNLNINPGVIIVRSNEPVGTFHAIQTLIQLLPVAAPGRPIPLPATLPCLTIKDHPHFRHRGMLLDCSRHFMTTDLVKKYIDLLAFYKMNVLHWHLTDDQGWRIQIDKYPLLTEVGAWRTEPDGTRYGGFYTKEEIRAIVKYASSRHITIIPEIELPGHCRAALAAYPELSCTGAHNDVANEWGVFKDIYCAGNDKTLAFIFDVMDEVCDLFPSRYIHIGGDEVPKIRWEQCPRCQKRMKDNKMKSEAELQSWFISQVSDHVAIRGKKIIGWDEIMEGGIPEGAAVQSWQGMVAGEKAATAQHFVVMSPTSHCYLDYSLATTDLRKVYSFDPIPGSLETGGSGFILGGECNMWTEHAPQDVLDSKVFPRMLAMSEVLWTYPENRDFENFYARVQAHLDRFDALHVLYGFPSVPVRLEIKRTPANTIEVSLAESLPGSVSQWSLESSEDATPKWEDYSGPAEISSPTLVKVKSEWRNRTYPDTIARWFDPHKGIFKPVTLSYTPSASYTGGGAGALTDGALGTNSFRDGIWQAVQGSPMEAVVDLGESMPIRSISSRWFHYSNAWIFRPQSVKYLVSNDGKKWREVWVSPPFPDPATPGEIVMTALADGLTEEARYIKMVATSIGPCPSWHEAAGEPSWLFCDELVIH